MKNTFITLLVLVLILAMIYFVQKISPISDDMNSQTNSEMLDEDSGVEVESSDVAYHETAQGYYVEPVVEGNYPGVVMVHEWWGLNQNIKDTAEQLAQKGYRVLAVDLYNGVVATTSAQAQQLRTTLTNEQAVANMQAATDYLREQGSTRIASLGWCFGGGKALELALSGENLDATVIYYGQLVEDPERLSTIKWPILGIFGDQDTSIPVESVRNFEEGLNVNNIENEIHIYPGVGHAFANPSGDNYAPEETMDAWQKTLAFLENNLK